MIYRGIDLFNIAVEVWLCYALFAPEQDERFSGRCARVLQWISFLGVTGGSMAVNRLLGIRYSNLQTLVLAAVFFTAGVIFTKRSAACILAWALISYGTLGLIELPGIVLGGWVTGQPFAVCIRQSIAIDYIYLLLLSARLLFVWKKWGTPAKAYLQRVIAPENAWLWAALGALEWGVITYFLKLGHTKSGLDMLIYNITAIMLILLLLAVFAAAIIHRQTKLLQKRKLLEEAVREERYAKLKAAYEQKSRLLHDMKHHLAPIASYLDSDQTQKARDYVNSLLNGEAQSTAYIRRRTGNPIVDCLLEEKVREADSRGIDFVIEGTLIGSTLSDEDMSVLFGNLLDNAFEAAAKAPDKKWVKVQMQQQGHMLILSVKNSLGPLPVKKNGKFISQKAGGENHGWGLESVRTIVHNHDGQIDFKYDEHSFEAAAILRG